MKVTLGKEGLKKTWQAEFPETVECCKCGKLSRIGFVAHEGIDEKVVHPRDFIQFVCDQVPGEESGRWLHDCCAVAVYFCRGCLNVTALYNQA